MTGLPIQTEHDAYERCLVQRMSAAGVVFGGGGNAGALFPVDDAADFAKGARYIPGEVTDARRLGQRVVFDPDEHRWTLPDGTMVPVVSQYRVGGVVFPAEYCEIGAKGVVRTPCQLNVTTGAVSALTLGEPNGPRAYILYAGEEFEVTPAEDGGVVVPNYKRLMQTAQRVLQGEK